MKFLLMDEPDIAQKLPGKDQRNHQIAREVLSG